MANRYWVGGGSSNAWNATGPTNWASTSGGANNQSVPTVADDVFFDANSGTGTTTISATANMRSINCTGFAGTISTSGSIGWIIGTSTPGASNIALKFSSGMTLTWGGSNTVSIQSTSATQQTLDFAGKSVVNLSNNSAGTSSSYILNSAVTVTGTLTLTRGTFNSSIYDVTVGVLNGGGGNVSAAGVQTRAINMGSGTWRFYGSGTINVGATGMTLTAGTATSIVSNTAGVTRTVGFSGLTIYNLEIDCNLANIGSFTCNNLTITGHAVSEQEVVNLTSDITVNGTLTMSGGSVSWPINVKSDTLSTQRSIICNGTVSINNVNLRDIVGAGSASWNLSSSRVGDALGNSGITFPASRTYYWINTSTTSQASNTVSNWSLTSGGSAGTDIPLAHDDIVFDDNSFSGSTNKGISPNTMFFCRNFDMSSYTGAARLFWNRPAAGWEVYYMGNCDMRYMMWNSTANWTPFIFAARSSVTIYPPTSNIQQGNVRVEGSQDATFTLLGDMDFSATGQGLLQYNSGNFDANDFDVRVGGLSAGSTSTRTLNMGSGTWTVHGQSGATTIWNTAATGLTINAETSTIAVTNNGSGNKTLSFGGHTYNDFEHTGGGTFTIFITVGATFNNFDLNPAGLRTLTVTAGQTITANNMSISGTSGNLLTINTTAAGSAFTLSCSGHRVVADYVSMRDCTATGGAKFYATNSTNVSNNTGWIFAAPLVIGEIATGSAQAYAPTITVVSGSSVQINAPPATGSAEASAPTITAVKNTSVSAPTSTATGQSNNPTISAVRNVSVSVPTSTGTTEVSAPSISISVSISVTTATGTAQSHESTVSAVKNVSVQALNSTATGQSSVPTITTQRSTTISSPAAEASGQALSPTVSVVRSVTLLPPESTGTATLHTPVVSATRSCSVSAPVSSATSAAHTPVVSITRSATIEAPVISGTAVAYEPVVTAVTSTSISSPTATGTSASNAPTITTQRLVEVQATAASGTAQANAPTVLIKTVSSTIVILRRNSTIEVITEADTGKSSSTSVSRRSSDIRMSGRSGEGSVISRSSDKSIRIDP